MNVHPLGKPPKGWGQAPVLWHRDLWHKQLQASGGCSGGLDSCPCLAHSYQAPSSSPYSSGLSPVGHDSNCPLFLLLNKYPFSSHLSSRCEAKWSRKKTVRKVVGETQIIQGSICPICVGSAGPKDCCCLIWRCL